MGKSRTRGRNPPPLKQPLDSRELKSKCSQYLKGCHGNPPKVLRKINGLHADHPNSAVVHGALAFFYFQWYNETSSSSTSKLGRLKSAALSVKQALSLSPKSMGINLLYNQVHLDLAKDSDELTRVIEHCESALLIDDPADPNDDIMGFELELSTTEGVKKRLVALIEKAKRKQGDNSNVVVQGIDEVGLSMPENDVCCRKKQETKRKDIENNLKMTRALQESLRMGRFVHEEDSSRRRKLLLRRVAAQLSKNTQAITCLKEMSSEEKRGLLEVRVDDIIGYYRKQDQSAMEILMEAINCGKETRKWKRFRCCSCPIEFWEWEELRDHVVSKHLMVLSERLRGFLQDKIKDESVRRIENQLVWKPLDVNKTLQEMSRLKDCGNSTLNDENTWIFCDDVERKQLLDNIFEVFKSFLRNNCLAPITVTKVVDHALVELKKSVGPGLEDLISGLQDSPLCICFLGSEQLQRCSNFLQMVASDCGLKDSFSDDREREQPEFCDHEAFHLNSDSSCLLLDERFLKGELDPGNIIADDENSVISVVDNHEEEFVRWLSRDDTIRELVKGWINLNDLKGKQASAVVDFIQEELEQLQTFSQAKCMLVDHEQNFESFLNQQEKELSSIESDSSVLELHVMAHVHPPDSESRIDGKQITQDIMAHTDEVDEEVIQKQKDGLVGEFCKLDTLMLKSKDHIKRMELKFQSLSARDYQVILLLLVKSYIRAHLEELAKKHAIDMTNASKEALATLANVAAYCSKNETTGSDNLRTMHKTSRRRKRKNQRKAVDKETGGNEEQIPRDCEDAEELICFPVASDGHCLDSSTNASINADESEQEEERKRKIELENLYGNLVYLGQIENNAKQDQLAEENNKTDATIAENVLKFLEFDDLKNFSGGPGMLCNPRSGEVNQGSSVQGIPKENALQNDWQGGKDGGGALSDASQVQKHLPLEKEEKLYETSSLKEEEPRESMTDHSTGKNYSSLNVIIQSLWHIPQFRNELTCTLASDHKHFGDPCCILCELAEIFAKISAPPTNTTREKIGSPTSLSIAIDKMSPWANLFEKGQVTDAVEVLKIILGSLHQSLTSTQDFSLHESEKCNCVGSWECTCLAHKVFGINISKRVNCDNCGLVSMNPHLTSFFHTMSSSKLIEKVWTLIWLGTSSLDDLSKVMLMDYYLACEPEPDGRGEYRTKYVLQTPPPVFIIVLNWSSLYAAPEDIKETLTAIATEIDISILSQGFKQGKKYRLISVVCYWFVLFKCFVYSHEYRRWTMNGDACVEAIGSWDCLCKMCVEKHYQPQILFFTESAQLEIDKKLPRESFLKEESGKSLASSTVNYVDRSGIIGAGLKNAPEENNCFLNVIIQSLWHIRLFRDKLTSSKHQDVGCPCIVCRLAKIFDELSAASTGARRDTVSPASLRIAISKSSPHEDRFQEGQMNDANEVLEHIFYMLHQSFTSSLDLPMTEPEQSNHVDSSVCTSVACLVHTLFGMHISECVKCDSCGVELRRGRYTSHYHMIISSQLRETKNRNRASSFDELLKIMLMEEHACGEPNCVQYTLQTPPHVFICVLVQESGRNSQHIKENLTALDTELDLGVVYQGLERGKKYCLVSMVCYGLEHYVCFVYSHEHKTWTMYDDAHVQVIGRWHDLVSKCVHEYWQPVIVFFEAVAVSAAVG